MKQSAFPHTFCPDVKEPDLVPDLTWTVTHIKSTSTLLSFEAKPPYYQLNTFDATAVFDLVLDSQGVFEIRKTFR